MFRFIKHKPENRVSFKSFVLERSISNPSLSLTDALDQYIAKYDLLIRTRLDETKTESDIRSRLQVLEEAVHEDAIVNPEIDNLLSVLRSGVQMYDNLPQEVRKRLK
jgi:cytosine/adenosine deaminase-related metal-dependent hydrolase